MMEIFLGKTLFPEKITRMQIKMVIHLDLIGFGIS